MDGVRLHYVERGVGPVVVLLHGQGALLQDFTQTILPELSKRYRVIAFDRPGSGYSSRPSGIRWTPERQARLFRSALQQMGVSRSIVLGHSWGALVALAYGLDYPQNSSGLVLLSGFFYPSGRALLDVANVAASPLVGPLLCNTLLPPLFTLTEPLNWRMHFEPHQVPERTGQYPFALTSRSSQLRTIALESSLLEPSAKRLKDRYSCLELPTAIIAGKGDQVVWPEKQSIRLQSDLRNSVLRLLDNCGHMPHFTHPDVVLQAIERVNAAEHSMGTGAI